MKIAEVYSHMNGLEYLKVHQQELWDQIEKVVNCVNAEECRTKVSKEKRMKGKMLYSPIDMNAAFKSLFELDGWSEQRTSYWVTDDARLIRRTMPLQPQEQKRVIEEAGHPTYSSYNQTDFVKERVAVEVQFGKYPFVAYDLFVKHMAFYVGDVIDVGVEILPVKELQADMSSGVAYYEGELYNLVRQGRGVPAVPLVLVGVKP